MSPLQRVQYQNNQSHHLNEDISLELGGDCRLRRKLVTIEGVFQDALGVHRLLEPPSSCQVHSLQPGPQVTSVYPYSVLLPVYTPTLARQRLPFLGILIPDEESKQPALGAKGTSR